MPRRVGRVLIAVGVVVSVVVVGVVGGLVLYERYYSGHWKFPTGDTFVRVKRVATGEAPPPSKVIYLHRAPLTLVAGNDDAPNNISSVIRFNGLDTATVPGFKGGDKRWKQIVACVTGRFKKYDVVVTDQRPKAGGYILVAVGGRPADVASKGHHTAGLAPFNSQSIPNAVVFAFSDQLGNRMRETCETIVMEVGHAYGLDHAFYCPDVMTYRQGCGPKGFRDQVVPCGENEARVCHNGETTQNSYRHLVNLLGAKPGEAPPVPGTSPVPEPAPPAPVDDAAPTQASDSHAGHDHQH